MTFASALRTVLRQDPDVIMVGEIRDAETAEIAVQAALTGHLVFSTLHTNDAAGAVARLLEMGVEDYLLASSLLGVLAQRLVRKICVDCRRPATGIAANEIAAFARGEAHDSSAAGGLWEGAGCETCGHSGFRGRSGIYELLMVDDVIRQRILERASADAIRAAAVSHGMRILREDGWAKARSGVTTLGELIRVTRD